jgi:hypothetical protein
MNPNPLFLINRGQAFSVVFTLNPTFSAASLAPAGFAREMTSVRIANRRGTALEATYFLGLFPATAAKVRSWADDPCCSRHCSKSRP